MSSAIAGLLDELAAKGIALAAEGDKLTLKGPRGALTPELREAVAAHKPALLARCRASPVQGSPGGPLPLSPGQERIYFLQRLSPESASYNVAIALDLTGPLEARALLLALDAVILRHQPLRASFTEMDGRRAQHVVPSAAITPEIIDLRGRPEAAEEIAAAQAERPFDLARGPLLRASLLRLAEDRHRLLLTFHHIVFDALSTRVLTAELAHNYAAFSAGRPPSLPPLPIQYSDFVAHDLARAEGPEVRRRLDYWRRRLASPPPALPPSPSLDPERRGAIRVGLDVDADRAARLDAFCRSEGVTRFMVLLAAFSLLLSRRSGGADITVGFPWSGRSRPELEGLIGFFVDTLVIRLAVTSDLGFRALVAQARAASLEAHAHAGVPLDRLVAEIAPGRRGGEAPLYQAMLNVVRLADERPALPGLEVDLSETMPGTRADLTLYALERPGSLRIELASASLLMDRAGAEEALAQVASLLSRAVDQPDREMATVSLLTPRFATVVPDPSLPLRASTYPPVHQLFMATARRSPDRIAVACSGRRWSYGEVRERSLAVAARLGAMGVGPGDRVAIRARRAPALIWTMIGVLHAGAAFVILDASHPPAWNAERIRIAAPAAVLDVDRSADPPLPAPEVSVDPDDLAYLAFTSGTTGVPRAVEGSHRPLAHFLDWYRRAFTLAPDDRFVLLSGLSHDPLLRDVFTPLTLGATLVIPGEDDLPNLPELLRREAVTVAHLTPAIGRMLRGPLPDLRLVCSAGDVLHGRDIEAIRAAAPGATLVNFYGATETPQAIAYHVVEGTPARAPIGRGIEGVDLLVLGRAGLAGVGELGEIAVRTPYLARGYAGEPEATRARFPPSPFRDDPTDRMYLTGDLGRFLPDGSVEIAGRRDAQIKVLGVRVDPGEVEAVLLSHPGVRAAAVAAFEVAPGDLRLAAWISGEATPAEVSAFARARLPEALRLVSVTALPALPLTSHGKVDRASLPAPVVAPPAVEVPPTALQDAVALAWTEVLGASPGDARRSFFELGGHSLLAARLVARIRQATSVDLPLAAVFEAPTLAGLTELVQEALEGVAVAPPTPVSHRGSLPASFAQRRLWFLDQLSPQDPAYRITGALHLQGRLDLPALERALVEVERRHEVLRTTYALVDGEVVQRVGEARDAVLDVVDLSHLPEEARRRAVIERLQEDTRRPFDLARGPIFRAALLALSTEEHVLAVAVHHIASDGWSMRLLRGEISASYQGRALPPLPLQYADYAAWQRATASSDRAERHLAYWRARLAGLPTLELPLSRPRPRIRQGRGAQRVRVIEGALLVALRDLGRRRGVTVFMTLLGALSLVLSRWTGGNDIPVGAPLGYRTEPSTFGIIGLFVHLAVLRIDLGGAPTFAALLQRAREAVLGAYAHRDLPFEQLVEALSPERDPSRTPLFQVFLNMQHATEDDLASLGDLRTERMPRPEPAANFDLTVRAIESDHAIELAVVYAVDVLEPAQADTLLDHLLAVLRAGVASPDGPIDDIVLPCPWPSERAAALSLADRETSLGARFLRQAEQSGDRIAVDTGGHRTSYAALAARARGAAGALGEAPLRGMPPRVALLFDHDAAMVAGLLGALIAGATYVPLDPALPDDRLAFMAADAGVSAILTHPGGKARARRIAPSGAAIVDLDEGPALPAALGDPGGEAYILYTSGSTGRPKGVVQSHRNALHHALTYARSLAITPEDRLSLLSTYAFDAALMDIFGALLGGATLCPLDLRAALADLGPAVDALQVSVLHATPTVFRRLVETLPPGRTLDSVRRVVLGGEETRRADVEAFERHFPERCVLVNGLGPTESTLALQCFVRRGDPLPRTSVPVGRAVDGVEVDLDVGGRSVVVPYGVGEIVIRSDFVALGYHGRPDLTAAAFSTGPDGRRAYRTGDLGRRLPDGAIEYAGRRDGQVKIRGHRVEIGEIEARLKEHPEVGHAAVVAKERAPGDLCLTAWITPRPGAEAPSARAVSSFLRARLPAAMIPAAISVIDALPLGPTGKIDRRALAERSLDPTSSASPAEAPRDALEASLLRVWEEVLDVRPIGVHDSFFDLGGHSLLAVRLLGKIQERLGRAVPLASLFEGATVANLATLLRDGASPRTGPARLVPMRAEGRLPPFVCLTPPGGRASSHFTDLLAHVDRERPFLALEPPSFGTAEGALQEAAARCRAALTLPGPYLLGGYSLGGAIAYELACQLEREGVEVASLVLLDTPAPSPVQIGRLAGEVDLRAFARYLARHVAEPHLGGRRAVDLPVTEGDLGIGDLDTRLARLVDEGRRAGVLGPSTPIGDVREALDYYQAQRRARAEALSGWSPGRCRAPLTVIRAAESRRGPAAPRALGWDALAGGDVTEHVTPGDHDTMLDPPAVAALAGALERLWRSCP